jgi:hypothetical protein
MGFQDGTGSVSLRESSVSLAGFQGFPSRVSRTNKCQHLCQMGAGRNSCAAGASVIVPTSNRPTRIPAYRFTSLEGDSALLPQRA